MGGNLSENITISKNMQKYFAQLQSQIDECYKIAEQARKIGLDPEYQPRRHHSSRLQHHRCRRPIRSKPSW